MLTTATAVVGAAIVADRAMTDPARCVALWDLRERMLRKAARLRVTRGGLGGA